MGNLCNKQSAAHASRAADLATTHGADHLSAIDFDFDGVPAVDPDTPGPELLLRAGLLPRCRLRTEIMRRAADLKEPAAMAWCLVYGKSTEGEDYASSNDGRE
jgi:hypothetical protein